MWFECKLTRDGLYLRAGTREIPMLEKMRLKVDSGII